jgi:electron transfer flavoprotein alpha/beta subunit
VTVDPNDRDLLFKTLYAVGVDNITQIKPNEELVFSPYKIAMMISNFAKLDYNVILFGMQNSLYNNCQTHYAVANALNIGCVSNVTNLEIINDDLKVYFDEDQYSIRGIVTPPVVIAVSNTQLPYLRMPTLREKLNAGKRSVNYIESSKLLSSQERKLPVDFQLKSVGHEKHTRNCKFLSERAEEFVEQIFKEYLN